MKIVLLTTFLISLVLPSPYRTPNPNSSARIIGGSNAFAGQYPFAAAIYTQTSTGTYFFMGSLVSNQWIITSGSCAYGAVLFTIRLGANDLDSTDALQLATETYVLHPDYNPNTLENDIGLILLRMPITLTDYRQPINLPQEDVLTYARVYAIGWGQISDSESGLSNSLQSVTLEAISNEHCSQYFGNQITDNMLCVNGNYNQGTCHGDTGGPLIQEINEHEALQAVIVGVSSFLSGNGCKTTDPSGYTRVFPYVEWIRNNTGVVV